MFLKKLFCNHKWEMKVDKTLPSGFEQANINQYNSIKFNMSRWMFQKNQLLS